MRRTDDPIFSVVLPTFNRPDTLQRAVASVLSQTFSSFEIIVVDDGSAEDYATALVTLRDPRIRLIRNRANLGVAGARNVGIAAVRGTYVSFLDDDDEYLSSFLASTHERLRGTSSDIALSWCGVRCIDYAREAGGVHRIRAREFAVAHPERTRLFEEFLSIGTGFGVSIKTACLRQVGCFDRRLKAVEDADMFLRLLSAGFAPVVVPGVQVVLHNHREVRLTSIANHETRIRECEWLLVRHATFLAQYPSLRRQLLHQIEVLVKELDTLSVGEALAHRR